MQESKLNSFQQRQLNSRVSSGQSLPSTCHPTTSAKPRKPAAKPPPPKVLNPRNYSGGVKNKEAIVASGAYERTDYKPRPQGSNYFQGTCLFMTKKRSHKIEHNFILVHNLYTSDHLDNKRCYI